MRFAIGGEHQGVVALHALYAGRQAAAAHQVRGHVGAGSVVAPISGAVQEQAGAVVVNQPEGLRVARHVLIHAVHPSAVPHGAAQARQGHRGRAAPIEVVEIERAAGWRGDDFHADFGDGIAAEVGHGPFQGRPSAGFHLHRGVAQRLQLVVLIEDADADGGLNGFVGLLVEFHGGAHGLAWGERRAGHQAVASALEVAGGVQRVDEGGGGGARALAGVQAVEVDRQAVFAAGVDAVLHHALVATEALHGAGVREVVARAAFGRGELAAGQRVAGADDAVGLRHRIAHPAAAVGAGQIADVGHRAAPVRAGVDAVEAMLDAEQTAEVAGVAVGVPAGRVDDLERLLEVVVAVQQGMHDQAVVRHHVAVAAVLVVAVVGLDFGEGGAPVVAVAGVPATDVADHAMQHAVGGNLRDADVEQAVGVRFHEGRRFHRRQNLGAVHGLAVVGDAGRPARQVGGALRVAGRHHRPAVDEDLRADLLRHDFAVHGDGAALRRWHARGQADERGVFGGVAEAAPPEDGAPLDQIVEPRLADLPRRDLRVAVVVLQRADEGEGAADVVVGDDQRHVELVVDVVVDLAQAPLDGFVRPSLERAPQVDADQLAEHAGVDALLVVRGQRGHRLPPLFQIGPAWPGLGQIRSLV